MKFHTKLALSKLIAGQSEVEKKLMTKLQSRLQPFVNMYYKSIKVTRSHLMITVVFSVWDSFTCLGIYGSECYRISDY